MVGAQTRKQYCWDLSTRCMSIWGLVWLDFLWTSGVKMIYSKMWIDDLEKRYCSEKKASWWQLARGETWLRFIGNFPPKFLPPEKVEIVLRNFYQFFKFRTHKWISIRYWDIYEIKFDDYIWDRLMFSSILGKFCHFNWIFKTQVRLGLCQNYYQKRCWLHHRYFIHFHPLSIWFSSWN